MAICGVKFSAYPTKEQKKILSEWIGCSRVIYNCKVEEDYRQECAICNHIHLDNTDNNAAKVITKRGVHSYGLLSMEGCGGLNGRNL